jgi:hypothetical protein
MLLPNRPLSRRAVKQFFTKVAEAKWEYWFRHEKENGLAELRVKGPFEKAYYSPSGMRDWLLAEGVYKPEDFRKFPAVNWLQAVAA